MVSLPVCAWLQEPAICIVSVFDQESVSQNGKEMLKGGIFVTWNFQSREDSSEIRSVVAIVKQADVPAAAKRVEKLQQRARPFRKLEPAKAFTFHSSRMTAHHVPHVEFCQFVVGQISGFVSLAYDVRCTSNLIVASGH